MSAARGTEFSLEFPMITSANTLTDVAQVLYSGDDLIDRRTGALIVTACNAHDELVAALRDLTGWVERVIVPTYSSRKPMPENCATALEAARAALAKAQP